MNTFSMNLICDHAAFEGDPRPEIVRILQAVISDLEYGGNSKTLHDVNGNTVGNYDLYVKDEE